MTTREILYGDWWLPSAPDRTVPGTLTLGETPEPGLELYDELIVFDAEEGPLTIHGDASGRKVSLLGVYPTQETSTIRGGKRYPVQLFDINFGALIGDAHVADEDESKFSESAVDIDYLTFISQDIDHSETAIKDKPDGSSDYSFTVTTDGRRSGRYGNVDATTIPEASFSPDAEFHTAEMRIRASFKTHVRLTSTQPISTREHVETARRLSDLVTLAMYRPAGVRRIVFNVSTTDKRHRYEWWGADPTSANERLDGPTQRAIAFDLGSVDLATLLPAWHTLNTKAVYGVQSIIGLLRETSTYHETKLLGVCGAIEALHRGLDSGNWTYRQRCEALAAIPSSAAVAQIIPDVAKWAGYVVKARNSLAHGDEPNNRKVPEDVWFALHGPTLALLVLVLMAELGISDEAQVHAVTRGALRAAARIGTALLN
ncbi:HEPN domain-containing protein [Nocardia sp. NPDC051981]|uniref:ApeA N-terminal domain 1-containing protein n=1 Tax=Nocardia sp. NPDC051981 TaxID=3155417 RepID=UPI00343A94CE